MMSLIYWVEDEIERLEGTKKLLERKGHDVRVIRSASDVLGSLTEIRTARAPIIFDLWIPPGDSPQTREFVPGPETGLSVLKELRANLGLNWPIWIVSGNLTRTLKERLMREFEIPLDRILSKPLNEKNEQLVDGIYEVSRMFASAHLPSHIVSSSPDQAGEVG
jgi:CheY-like chemotaxis protein